MEHIPYPTRWARIVRSLLHDKNTTYKTLASRPEASTFLLKRKDHTKTVLRLMDLELYTQAQLQFEWDFLNTFKNTPDFPSQKPIGFYDISENVRGIELSYIEGYHPRVNSKIAQLHKYTRNLEFNNLPNWDAQRITRHFDNKVLLGYFTQEQKEVVLKAIDKVAHQYEKHWYTGVWTGVVHSDTHKHNMIISSQKGTLIDFGECGKGVLFWDIGVAIADTEMDYPNFAQQCRENLLAGYVSVLPESADILQKDINLFTTMRVLEVMTWPVSSWSKEYRIENEESALDNIRDCINYLQQTIS